MISTVVSLSKMPIFEEIPGMFNSPYMIDVSKDGIPNILIIQDSFYYKPDLDGRQDKVMVAGDQIATSICHMHITSQLLYRVDQHPAIFCIPGMEVDAPGVIENFKKEIKDSLVKQRQWFVSLVRLADDDWQHLRKHRMISDIQRMACKELGLKREWVDAVPDEDTSKCPFCGSELFDKNAPICPVCHKVHNQARLAELESRVGIANPVTGRITTGTMERRDKG